MRHLTRALAVLTFSVLGPIAANAQNVGTQRIAETCKAELTTLCADATKGGPPFLCLVDNQAKLGADCAAAIKVVQERREKMQTACKADADTHCPGVDRQRGGLMRCLRDKQTQLSKGCADVLAQLPAPAVRQ